MGKELSDPVPYTDTRKDVALASSVQSHQNGTPWFIVRTTVRESEFPFALSVPDMSKTAIRFTIIRTTEEIVDTCSDPALSVEEYETDVSDDTIEATVSCGSCGTVHEVTIEDAGLDFGI